MSRPMVVVLVDDKTMTMLNLVVMMWVNMRLFAFPTFVLMLVMLIMIMWMMVVDFKMAMF